MKPSTIIRKISTFLDDVTSPDARCTSPEVLAAFILILGIVSALVALILGTFFVVGRSVLFLWEHVFRGVDPAWIWPFFFAGISGWAIRYALRYSSYEADVTEPDPQVTADAILKMTADLDIDTLFAVKKRISRTIERRQTYAIWNDNKKGTE